MTKPIRHYVSEIISLPTINKRRAALLDVPEHERDNVKILVVEHFEKQACLKQQLHKIDQQGRYARQTGLSKSECPFVKQDGKFRNAWLKGWDDEDSNIKLRLGR